jgi:hypothetical protein
MAAENRTHIAAMPCFATRGEKRVRAPNGSTHIDIHRSDVGIEWRRATIDACIESDINAGEFDLISAATFFEAITLINFVLKGAGAVALVFVGRALWRWSAPALYREVGLNRPRQVMICTERDELVEVSAIAAATISARCDCVFLKEPGAEDLALYHTQSSDIQDPGGWIQMSGVNIIAEKRVNDRVAAKFWAPDGGAKLFRPFSYTVKIQTDAGLYGPDGFFKAVDVDRRTGLLKLEIRSERPMARVFLRRVPQLLTQVAFPLAQLDDKLVWELVISRRRQRTSFEQPALSSDGHKVTWQIQNPKMWSRFIVVCSYQDSDDKVDAWRHLRSLSARENILLWLLRAIPS